MLFTVDAFAQEPLKDGSLLACKTLHTDGASEYTLTTTHLNFYCSQPAFLDGPDKKTMDGWVIVNQLINGFMSDYQLG